MTRNEQSIRFTPSAVKGRESVSEVAIFPNRLELSDRQGTMETVRFSRIGQRQTSLLASLLRFQRPGPKMVAERCFFPKPWDCLFRFYTHPPITVYMPADEEPNDYTETTFFQVRRVIESGCFSTFDLA